MENILITYDLLPTNQNYPLIINRIKEVAGKEMFWSELKSVWIIRTEHSSKAIFEMLSSYVDDNDKLLVLTLEEEGKWKGFNDPQSKFLRSFFR